MKENILYTEAWKKSYRESKGNTGASNQIRAHGDPQTGRVSATDSRSNIWAQRLHTDDPVQKALGSRPLKKAAYIYMRSSWDWELLDPETNKDSRGDNDRFQWWERKQDECGDKSRVRQSCREQAGWSVLARPQRNHRSRLALHQRQETWAACFITFPMEPPLLSLRPSSSLSHGLSSSTTSCCQFIIPWLRLAAPRAKCT